MIQLPARNDSGVKSRILFLDRYFLDHTDENHVLSTEDIVNLCTEHRYKTQRVTVADDIESPEYVKDSYETMLKTRRSASESWTGICSKR